LSTGSRPSWLVRAPPWWRWGWAIMWGRIRFPRCSKRVGMWWIRSDSPAGPSGGELGFGLCDQGIYAQGDIEHDAVFVGFERFEGRELAVEERRRHEMAGAVGLTCGDHRFVAGE